MVTGDAAAPEVVAEAADLASSLGPLPYATAKAALEGLTRAMAVDYGPAGSG